MINFLQLFDERGKCQAFDTTFKKLNTLFNNNTDQDTTTLMSYLSEKCGQLITNTNIIKLYDLFICQACIKINLIIKYIG